eukprot:m.19443 g.19443  ORF g.19443 m.19443 type:complete len:69 (-) comp3692_c0_seq1:2767-2973(-)
MQAPLVVLLLVAFVAATQSVGRHVNASPQRADGTTIQPLRVAMSVVPWCQDSIRVRINPGTAAPSTGT